MGFLNDLSNGFIAQKLRYLAENAEPLDVAAAALMCTVNTIKETGRVTEMFTEADMSEISDLLDIAKMQAAGIADLQCAEDKLGRVKKAFEMLKQREGTS